jgi:hypothetical protein
MLSERQSSSIILTAALNLAERGIHVLPCRPGSKLPATSHGVKDATTDPQQIHTWFEKRRNLNLAIRCGTVSGLFAIDIDPRNGGVESITNLLKTHGPLSDYKCPTVLNGGGGFHFFLQSPGFPVRKKSLGPGVDVIGENRYTLSPPSLHESGNFYGWKPGYTLEDLGIPVAAPWVLDQLKTPATKPEKTVHDASTQVEEGARDLFLISYCGQKIAQGLNRQEVCLLVCARNEEVCWPPLPEDELFHLVDHALKRYTKPGISGNHFKPNVYAYELMMQCRPVTYRGVTFRCSGGGKNYEIWDTPAIKSEIYRLSERTLTPKQINVALDLLRLESHVGSLAEVPGVREKEFIEQCLEEDPLSRIFLREIYSSYKQWCRRHRVTPVSQTDLRKLIESKYGVLARRLTGGAYGFSGIRVREDPREGRLC